MSVSVLFTNLVGLFLLMAVGVVLVKGKAVPITVTGYLSKLLMTVMSPAMIVRSMLQPFSADFLKDSAVVFAAGFGL